VKEAHMSTTDDQVDMHLEIDVIPVSDVDRAKAFYDSLGWRFDADEAPLAGLRIVQYTPPGSGASITFGEGLNEAAPGSAVAGLTVSDIKAAHDELASRGIDVSDVWHGPPFPSKRVNPAATPRATATDLSFPLTIPMAICGSSRRSPRGSPAESDYGI
jgi:catechol 2,3-dioxygenase-like lactoylglutathione lyase family enzyme